MKLQENEIKPTWLYIKHHSITGMKYFGCTTKYRARNYDGSGIYWSNHIKKHGRKFVVTDLLIGPYTNKEELKELALWISTELDIVNSKEWANLIPENGINGGRNKGWKHSEETRKKIKENIKCKPDRKNVSKETREKLSKSLLNNKNSLGCKPSEETKLKIGKARKGKKHSEEAKLKITKSLLNNKNSLGYKHSEESKDKMRNSHLGKKRSEESIIKQKEAMNNKPILICEYCGKNIKGKSNLNMHISAKHNGEIK